MPSSIKNVVIITGASRGIGLALCKEYLKKDYLVFGCARHQAQQPISNVNFDFSVVDVSNFDQVKRFSNKIIDQGLCPKTIINNAAIVNETLPLWEIPTRDFDLLIDINIKGVANILRAFLPTMLKQKRGTIINMSSGWGQIGDKNVSSYCASKFAVEGLTQSLSKEVPKGMIVAALSPGVVKTEMLKSCAPHWYDDAVDANAWAQRAVLFIENLSVIENGKSLELSLD